MFITLIELLHISNASFWLEPIFGTFKLSCITFYNWVNHIQASRILVVNQDALWDIRKWSIPTNLYSCSHLGLDETLGVCTVAAYTTHPTLGIWNACVSALARPMQWMYVPLHDTFNPRWRQWTQRVLGTADVQLCSPKSIFSYLYWLKANSKWITTYEFI